MQEVNSINDEVNNRKQVPKHMRKAENELAVIVVSRSVALSHMR
jgi:hypothetical protein